MKRKIDFDYNEETGMTLATLKTSIGTFFGMSCKHPNDEFPPSYSVGMKIAEARAYISLYNRQLYNKRLELKGIQRLMCAIPRDNAGYKYVDNLYTAMLAEYNSLLKAKQEAKQFLNEAIDARAFYIKSRKTDRKAREEGKQKLKQAFETLNKAHEMVENAKKDN